MRAKKENISANFRKSKQFSGIIRYSGKIPWNVRRKIIDLANIYQQSGNFCKKWKMQILTKFEIWQRCKGMHCVDLGESFPTYIFLQNLASIQQRTSLVEFLVRKSFSVVALQQAERLVVSLGSHFRLGAAQHQISNYGDAGNSAHYWITGVS